MKILGICNLHDGPHLGQLTKHHPLGTVTFLGRYGLMDFTLSNFSNSGIDNVAILAESHTRELHSHIKNGNVWVNNTKTGSQTILFNENSMSASTKFNTDINNLLENIDFFNEGDIDYVVVSPVFFLTPLDFRPIIDSHVKSGKEITLVYKHIDDANKRFINCDKVKVNKEFEVIEGFSTNSGSRQEADISLEVFVINFKTFINIIKMTKTVSALYSLRKMVEYCSNEKLLSVHSYETNEEVIPILSLQSYVEESMKLLVYANRLKLFKEDWPIYTTTHNTPPSLYGPNAQVRDSFIANGSVIKGKVENCIISRGVKIGEGAIVKNSILFYKTDVGDKVNLNHVLADKYVQISKVRKLAGTKDEVFFIELGAKI